jgi:hypothetical protein
LKRTLLFGDSHREYIFLISSIRATFPSHLTYFFSCCYSQWTWPVEARDLPKDKFIVHCSSHSKGSVQVHIFRNFPVYYGKEYQSSAHHK